MGLRYSSTAFVWAKQNKTGNGFFTGMGMTTRKRGSQRIRAHDVRELIVSPRREHTRKPDEIYEQIERLVDGPYLECSRVKGAPAGSASATKSRGPRPAARKRPPWPGDDRHSGGRSGAQRCWTN